MRIGKGMYMSGEMTCPDCRGTGEVSVGGIDPGDSYYYYPCSYCSGSGWVPSQQQRMISQGSGERGLRAAIKAIHEVWG